VTALTSLLPAFHGWWSFGLGFFEGAEVVGDLFGFGSGGGGVIPEFLHHGFDFGIV